MTDDNTVYPAIQTTVSARLFVQSGRRPRNTEEQAAYVRAYLLKSKACPDEIVEACASDMAIMISGETCILIPVPDCKGGTYPNLRLALSIQDRTRGKAQVMDILTRSRPTESQCQRHRRGEAALTPEELKITVRPHKPFTLRKVYFVDNVTTSGATIQACHEALGFGTGLVYAEALRRPDAGLQVFAKSS
jgi:hypothetical protein